MHFNKEHILMIVYRLYSLEIHRRDCLLCNRCLYILFTTVTNDTFQELTH